MRAMFLKAALVAALSVLLPFGAASTNAGSALAQNSKKTQPAAQSSEQPSWVHVVVVRVKPDMVPEFLKLAKETIPAHRKAGVEWRDFWVTDNFGDVSEYTIITPFDKLAQYDAGNLLEQGFGKAGFEAWRAKLSRIVESVTGYAVRTRPELSFTGKIAEQPKLAVVVTTRVMPGREQEFENFVKNDYLPVMKRAPGLKAFFVGQTIFGGSANEYVTVGLVDNFADLDKGPPIRRVLNEAEAEKLMKKLAPGVIVSQTRSVMRYIPELSYMPAETATNSPGKEK
jgi:antibiotic biosynthesis monooxygenase (ABM) superfamily enzyme